MANKRTKKGTPSQTPPRRQRTRAPKTFTKVTTPEAKRLSRNTQAKIDYAKELFNWASHAPTLPPKTSAMITLPGKMLSDVLGKLAKITACASMEKAIGEIDILLTKFGDQLSKEDYDRWNKEAEELWEGMVNLGCD